MNDFEPFDDDLDDDLAAALQRRVSHIDATGIETTNAHDAVLGRARGIRRRRAGIAGFAALAAVIAGGALLLNGNADDTLAPATEPSTGVAPETSPVPSTSTVPSTSVGPSATTIPATAVTSIPETAMSTMPAPTDAQPPPSLAVQTAPPLSSPSSTPTTTSSSTSSTVATQGPAPFTRTYASSGGSITVSWDGSALSLDAVNPAEGHTAETEDDSSTRVRVRFRGSTDSRIEVRFENGQVTERID
jgi:hypothetical protein